MAESGDAGLWPWLALAGLGAFHGLNPAMGWLFAVALGLHRGSRRVVLVALLPIALGHALAVLAVVLVVMAFGPVLDPELVRRAAGLVLIGWAAWHALYGHRHRVRFGMHDRPGRPRRLVVPDGHGARRRPDADPAAGSRWASPPADAPPRHAGGGVASARRWRRWRSTASPCWRRPAWWRCWSMTGSAWRAAARLGQSRPGVDGGAGGWWGCGCWCEGARRGRRPQAAATPGRSASR